MFFGTHLPRIWKTHLEREFRLIQSRRCDSTVEFQKIYVDTVAHSPEALEYCLKVYGADKLLYGTDHPFAHFEVYNEMVDNLDCSESDRELINHGNAERIIGL